MSREVMQQALMKSAQALLDALPAQAIDDAGCWDEYEALRAAIAEPQAEPVADWLRSVCRYISDTLADGTPKERTVARTIMHMLPLDAALAAPPPQTQAEPTVDAAQWKVLAEAAIQCAGSGQRIDAIKARMAALTGQPQAEQPNLADPAVQKRLAAQWGYMLPQAEQPAQALPEPDVTALCDYFDEAGQRHGMAYSVDAMRAALAAAPRVPPGYKLVPVEPTPEMLDAAFFQEGINTGSLRGAWQDMLAAAPQPEGGAL